MSDALTIDSGTKTISVTNAAERLATARTVSGVLIRADDNNAAVVRLKDSTVSAASFPLPAGKAIGLDMVDIGNIFVRGTAGDIVYWIVTVP